VCRLIAGRVVDAAYAAELKALAAARNLGGRIQFLGPRDDVMALMRRAACLIHCPESEAVGWVLLEAMSAGLPIVATSVGGIPELIQDGVTGLMAQAGDVNALALSMRRLVTERDAARSLAAEASRQVRERHSASAMVNRLADLYRNVCRHARAR
jgi:glycosyltransferase involved in cell wall biosynthesis